jgi:serine/threonine protein kinase
MIVNKYEMGEEIKRGAFGCILKGVYVKKREPVAIKIEYGGIQSLKHEVKIMNYLATSGVKQIPNIYWYGIHNNNPCLVFTLYECSLFDYMEKKDVTIEKMNILMIKAIDIIEYIHRFFVLHRDIKPQNFMVKNGDIFLIDFGLATFYIDENGEHYPNKMNDTIIGTPKFVSINIHMGYRYSRRDDLISLGYMYVYMVLGQAPWFSNIIPIHTNKSLIDIDHPINIALKEQKQYDKFFTCFLDFDNRFYQIEKYIEYTYALEYIDIPKYIPLKLIFHTT